MRKKIQKIFLGAAILTIVVLLWWGWENYRQHNLAFSSLSGYQIETEQPQVSVEQMAKKVVERYFLQFQPGSMRFRWVLDSYAIESITPLKNNFVQVNLHVRFQDPTEELASFLEGGLDENGMIFCEWVMSLSVFSQPDKEQQISYIKVQDVIRPAAYQILSGEVEEAASSSQPESQAKTPGPEGYEIDASAQVDENVIYSLAAVDFALGGKAFYQLYRTQDGGTVWEMVNQAPFEDYIQRPYQMCFFTQDLGFVLVPLGGKAEGTFFRTDDGGQSFQKLSIPLVPFQEGNETVTPFVQPREIRRKEDCLVMTVGQGQDGDFQGGDWGCLAQFTSEDQGITWQFEQLLEGDKANEPG